MFLSVRHGETKVEVEVTEGGVEVGRATAEFKAVGLPLPLSVSRVAARVFREGNAARLEVLSTNPLRLVGQDGLNERILARGDAPAILRLGDRLYLHHDAKSGLSSVECTLCGTDLLSSSQHEPATQQEPATQSTPVVGALFDPSPLDEFLDKAGLGEFKVKFRAEEIEMEDAKLLTNAELREVFGFKLGHLKKWERAATWDAAGDSTAAAVATMSPAAASIPGLSQSVENALKPHVTVDQHDHDHHDQQQQQQQQPIEINLVDGDMMDIDPVEVAPPPPPPPPVKCHCCEEIAVFVCLVCRLATPAHGMEIDLVEETPLKCFCYSCWQTKHLEDSHAPRVLNHDLFLSQRTTFEGVILARQKEVLEGIGQSCIEIQKVLSHPIASGDRMQQLRAEAEAIRASIEIPQLSVIVLGDTGSGKSSTLNALLGEEGVLPTSGMRACTASLIELHYNRDGDDYRAEVEFLTREEWDEEMEILLSDLTLRRDPEACLPRSPDPSSPAGIAMAKVKIVYGVGSIATVEDFQGLRRQGSRITAALGKNKVIRARTGSEFRQKIERYADSADESNAMAYWPIVKCIRCFGPWDCLRSGVILVDAPGIRDDNSARDAVVKSRLKSAGLIVIVSRIQRAVNDKAARNLLGDSFRRQVFMDGRNGSSLCFVATQSDLVNRQELAHNLKLNPEQTSARDAALARNRWASARIQKDYVQGLRDVLMAGKGNKGNGDDDDDDDDDDDNDFGRNGFDPEIEQRLQAARLPVFCVSSKEYMCLTGLLDDPPQVFDDVIETGIPALSNFLYRAAIRSSQSCLDQLVGRTIDLARLVASHLSDSGNGKKTNQVKPLFENLAIKYEKSSKVIDLTILSAQFDQVMPSAIESGISGSNKVAAQFASPFVRGGWPRGCDPKLRKGGLHWCTMRALTRRNGRFTGTAGLLDFNEEVSEPLLGKIAPDWDQVFGQKIPAQLDLWAAELSRGIDALLAEFFASCSGVVESARIDNIKYQLQISLPRITKNKITALRAFISEQQKDISRLIVPMVQESLTSMYQNVATIAGAGTRDRQCQTLISSVSSKGPTMFKSAAELLQKELTALFHSLEKQTQSLSAELINDARMALSVLWESVSEEEVQNRALLNAQLAPIVQATIQRLEGLRGESSYFVAPSNQPDVVEAGAAPAPNPWNEDKEEGEVEAERPSAPPPSAPPISEEAQDDDDDQDVEPGQEQNTRKRSRDELPDEEGEKERYGCRLV